MAIDQHKLWSNLAADIGDIGMLELDDVFLKSTILLPANFAVLDLRWSVARLAKSIDDFLRGDESVASATGRCGMGSRDGVFVNDFEVWDDDVHFCSFCWWVDVLGGTKVRRCEEVLRQTQSRLFWF